MPRMGCEELRFILFTIVEMTLYIIYKYGNVILTHVKLIFDGDIKVKLFLSPSFYILASLMMRVRFLCVEMAVCR